jgi:hypothetical protein
LHGVFIQANPLKGEPPRKEGAGPAGFLHS